MRRWAEPLTVLFVILLISYVNIVKNLEAMWFPSNTVAQELYGIASSTWFNAAYAILALAVAIPVVAYSRGRQFDILPSSRLGKAQLLYLVFLWWMVLGNLMRTVPFAEQRLITEGVIHVNACLCTLLALLLPSRERMVGETYEADFLGLLKRFAASAVLVGIIVVVAEFGAVNALWGTQHAGHSKLHKRFDPDTTIDQR